MEGDGRTSTARGRVIEVVETVVLTAVIFLGIQTFVAQPFKVVGISMETTLLPDQYVLIDKLTPNWVPYRRGDIVVLHPPATWSGAGSEPFIKRVIAVAGDNVKLTEGAVYVNGTKLDEPYVFSDSGGRQTTDPSSGGLSNWLVPPGELLVMGDHRQESADSRVFGPIEVSQVIGRGWLRYWPLTEFEILPS